MPLTAIKGESIKIVRTLRGWSQPELGRRAGLDMWRIWSIENDVYPAIPKEPGKILHALTTE